MRTVLGLSECPSGVCLDWGGSVKTSDQGALHLHEQQLQGH